jgi:hypothetical protein
VLSPPRRLIAGATSENTRRGYETGLRQFTVHAKALGLEPLGAHPALVGTFLGHMRDVGAPEFLHAARRITDLRRSGVRYGAAGQAVCAQFYGVTPDAFTLAQSLAGALQPGDHGTTFGGSPVPAAAAFEHLHVRDALDLETQVEVAGTLLRDEVAAIARLVGGLRRTARTWADARLAGLRSAHGSGGVCGAGTRRRQARSVTR